MTHVADTRTRPRTSVRAIMVTLVTVASCTNGVTSSTSPVAEETAARVVLTPSTIYLAPNATTDFVAVGFTATGDSVRGELAWSATGGNIEASSTSGARHLARYHAGGTCETFRVIATASPGAKADTSEIVVTCAPPASVANVAVTPSAPSVERGATVQLSAVTRDSSANVLGGRAVTWSSSATSVATVSGSGLVTGVAAGSATITATSEGKSGTSAVTVTVPAPPAVATVTVTPPSSSLQQGNSVQLTATTRDASGTVLTGRAIAWSTSAPSIATISGEGLVTAVGPGTATLTATSEGRSGTAVVTVTPPPTTGGSVITDASRVLTIADVPRPGYLSPVSPAPFGLRVTRISNEPGTAIGGGISGSWGTDARHHYQKDQPWSRDGALLVLQNNASPSQVYLDGETYQPVRGKCANYSIGDDRWHPTLAHAQERISASGLELKWFNVVTCTKTRSWALPFSVNGIGPSEGNASFDGRFVALADGTRFFVVDMDPQPPFAAYPAQRIGPARSVTDCGIGSCAIDWVSISPSGKYAIVSYDGDYVRVFNVNPTTLELTPRPMQTTYASCSGTAANGFIYDLGHADMTLNPFDNNEDVIIGQEHCGNRGKTISGMLIGGVMMSRIRDGAITPLTDPTNEAYPHHVSARNYDRPGWVYVGYYPAADKRFDDEIVAIRIDGSKSVERLAHKHSAFSGCYRCESHAVPSPDGQRVLWASNWVNNAGSGPGTSSVIQAYIVDKRP